uniref:Uncharacterized protein n=1 Tax=Arundo donax TaxID=35708 RepID=A0A0A9GLD1_ARUDO
MIHSSFVELTTVLSSRRMLNRDLVTPAL